jgi:bifunctional polynucleotide phosphatase/kinase
MRQIGNGGTTPFRKSCESFMKKGRNWCCNSCVYPAVCANLDTAFNRYVVAVLSNQAGISLKPDPKTIKSDQKRLADFKAKVSAVFTQLELPISVYAATSHDRYRKPRVGMWEELREDYDLESADAVDLDNSFFVGDAAGREASGGRTKDFSCGDRLVELSDCVSARMKVLKLCRNFAANVGIDFHTPEEYFLGEDPSPFTREFDPTAILQKAAAGSIDARRSWVPSHMNYGVPRIC